MLDRAILSLKNIVQSLPHLNFLASSATAPMRDGNSTAVQVDHQNHVNMVESPT
jgi:hypothetical protein